jgi:pyrroloquinoline quinone biosynthesis protein E
MSWLELCLDYRCNQRCLGCRACEGGDEGLTTADAARWLRWGRTQGISGLWLGGGEPTLRDDLGPIVRQARRLGYGEVLLQTNGLRLAYDRYAAALVEAGVGTVRLNLKSADAAVHDALCQRDGAHALVEQALGHLASRPVALLGDLLLTRATLPGLAATVRHYSARGVRGFSLWLLSAHDSPGPEVGAAVPALAEVAGPLAEAARVAAGVGVTIESLHTPPCALPEALRPLFRPPSSWGLTIVDASQRPFSLEGSAFEGGAFLPSCQACALRPGCPGPRADYLALHGAAEFVPVTEKG